MKFSEEEKVKFEEIAVEMGHDVAEFTSSVAILVRGFVKFVSKVMPEPLALSAFETFKEDINNILDKACKDLTGNINSMEDWINRVEEVTGRAPEEDDDLGIEDDEE